MAETKADKAALEKASAEAAPPEGVFVLVKHEDNGDLAVNPQIVGDVRITEVDTVLALARKEIKNRLGID